MESAESESELLAERTRLADVLAESESDSVEVPERTRRSVLDALSESESLLLADRTRLAEVEDPLLSSSELSESDRTRLREEEDAELTPSESLELAERTRRELAELSESLELAERTRRELAELAELSESELVSSLLPEVESPALMEAESLSRGERSRLSFCSLMPLSWRSAALTSSSETSSLRLRPTMS